MQIIIAVLAIALFGALVRTIFGFGEALVTMPLLALVGFDLQTSTALIGALGLIVALPATIRYRTYIDFAVVKRLVIGSFFGIPIGILLVKKIPREFVLGILGIFLIVYGSYSLTKILMKHTGKARLKSNKYDYWAGLIAGALGSAYNSHGVPVAIYGTLKKWSPDKVRGILQAHFLCVGVLVVISQLAAGFWSMDVVKLLLLLIPGLLVVIPLGNYLFDRIPKTKLILLIYGLLIFLGILLLIQQFS